jgi:hypothetical protein
MRLSPLYLPWLLGFSALTHAAAVPIRSTNVRKRDADFYSVRTKLTHDMSGRGDPPDKYFRGLSPISLNLDFVKTLLIMVMSQTSRCKSSATKLS